MKLPGVKFIPCSSGGTYKKGKKLVEFDNNNGVFLADFSIDSNTVISTKYNLDKDTFISLVKSFLL